MIIMRVLIIEDNPTISKYLAKGLAEHYFSPEIASDGQEGLFLLENGHYDLVILDIMLPLIDGWTLIEKIRERDKHLFIICLTAKDTLHDKLKGFQLGADDYLIKPFAFSELLVRMRSLLRRNSNVNADIIQIADLTIDIHHYKVTRNNKPIHLSAKEFMLLHLFAKKAGEVLSRTYIAEQVWDIHFDCESNVIDVAVKRLREKIDKNFAEKLIQSVRGVGYVLSADK